MNRHNFIYTSKKLYFLLKALNPITKYPIFVNFEQKS
jgi:hypothetical protein